MSYLQLLYHIVFRPKNSTPAIPTEHEEMLYRYIWGYIKEHREQFPHFNGWGKSYCALTHSYQEKDKIVNYIRNQKEHHRRMSFHDELLSLVREYGVEFDERFFLVE